MSENENNWEVIFFKESVEGVNVVKSAKKKLWNRDRALWKQGETKRRERVHHRKGHKPFLVGMGLEPLTWQGTESPWGFHILGAVLGAWHSRTRDGVENEDQLVDGLPYIQEALGLIFSTMQTRCGGTFHTPQ